LDVRNRTPWANQATGLAYGNGVFVVGYTTGSVGGVSEFDYSTDGVNWSFTNPFTYLLTSLYYINGYFYTDYGANSTDGITWSSTAPTGWGLGGGIGPGQLYYHSMGIAPYVNRPAIAYATPAPYQPISVNTYTVGTYEKIYCFFCSVYSYSSCCQRLSRT
jgi:hypothetical protein